MLFDELIVKYELICNKNDCITNFDCTYSYLLYILFCSYYLTIVIYLCNTVVVI